MSSKLQTEFRVRKIVTPEIRQELCDLIAEGKSIDEATRAMAELYDVHPAKSTVWSWPEYINAKKRKNERRYRAQREAAENGIASTINQLVSHLEDMHAERLLLQAERDKLLIGTQEYSIIRKNIKDLDIAYADHANKYQGFIEQSREIADIEQATPEEDSDFDKEFERLAEETN